MSRRPLWVEAKNDKKMTRFYDVLATEFMDKFGPLEGTKNIDDVEDEDEEVEVDDGDDLQDDGDDFSELPVGLYSPSGSEVDTDIATAKKKPGFKGTRKVRGPSSIFTTH